MTVELRHLRYMIAVADEGHITRAAERLGMQQPPLSRLIKTIEQEINVQLFHRVPRGVELTDAGRAFIDGARAIFVSLDRTLESARRTARGEEGRISVGFTTSAAFHPLVPRVIREYREAFPLVSVALTEDGPVNLIEGMKNDQIDAVFIRTPVAKPEGLVVHPLLEEEMVVALPTGHSLARNNSKANQPLPLKALSDQTFVAYGRAHGAWAWLRDAIFAACRTAGFSPSIAQEAPHLVSTLPLVAAGIGVSIVPSSMQQMNIRGVVYRRLKGSAQLKAPLNLAMPRRDSSSVSRQFLSLARQAVKNFVRD
jgi:DNA-binding transcriptional LysR family regulator